MKDVYPEKTVKYCILKYPTTSIQQNTYATRNRHLESFYSKNTLYHFILLNPQLPTIKPQKRKYYLFFVSYTLILSSQHCFAISRSNSTLDKSVSETSSHKNNYLSQKPTLILRNQTFKRTYLLFFHFFYSPTTQRFARFCYFCMQFITWRRLF